jgi:hypothetical protein
MNRRQFLQMTVSIAAAAALPIAVAGEVVKALPLPQLGQIWIPTVPQVAEWLEYYKITVAQANQRFQDIVLGLSTDGESALDLAQTFQSAERDFYAMEGERTRVAYQQYSGYEAGRSGRPRQNVAFAKPSHPAFGWYNYWAVGDYDRRFREGLPRLGRTLEEEYKILREQEQRLIAGTKYLPA